MINAAAKYPQTLLRESFLPVLLILVGLFVVIGIVKVKASIDAERIITIQIRNTDSSDEDADTVELLTDASLALDSETDKTPIQLELDKLIAAGNWKQAKTLVAQQVKRERSSVNVNMLGYLYFKQGRYEEALSEFDAALSLTPVYPAVFLNRGLVFARTGRIEEAIDEYKRLLKIVPHHFEAHFNLGVAYLEIGDLSNAIEALEKASTLTGGFRKAKALFNLGLAYKRGSGAKNRDLANKVFKSAIRIRPDYVRPRLAIALLQPKTVVGEEVALDQFKTVLQLKPDYPPAYFYMGLFYSKRSNINKAIGLYQKAIQFDPSYRKAKYNLGTLYLSQKRWADARVLFEQLLDSGKSSAEVHFQLGRAAYGEKDYERALNEYSQAIDKKNGKYAEAYLNMGLVYKHNKQYNEAINAYMTALEQKRSYPQAWYNLGFTYKQIKKNSLAEKAFLSAIEQKPDYEQAWFNLGALYTRMNEDDRAIEAYIKAIEIKPDYIKAKLNLAVRYAKKNQLQKAIKLYRSIVDEDEEYATAWINMGIAFYKLGDYGNAKQALIKSSQLEPDNVKPMKALAEIYVKEKEYEVAITLLREIESISSSDPDVRIQLAAALRLSGNKAEALAELKKAKALGAEQGLLKQEYRLLGR